MPVRLREVVYTLSPFETTVLNGLWKDLPQKAHRKISEVSCMARLWLLGQGWGCDSEGWPHKMVHRRFPEFESCQH